MIVLEKSIINQSIKINKKQKQKDLLRFVQQALGHVHSVSQHVNIALKNRLE
jgi:predicted RNA-binding protein YlxR (DUF448 family)